MRLAASPSRLEWERKTQAMGRFVGDPQVVDGVNAACCTGYLYRIVTGRERSVALRSVALWSIVEMTSRED